MTVTASSARLVLASATIAPNRIISGSFWNCGAPPDSEIAVAIAKTQTTVAESVAANAAIQSIGPGMPVGAAIAWKIARSTTAMTAKFARLNAIFTADTRDVRSMAMRRTGQHRDHVLVRGEEEEPGHRRDLAQRERVGLAPEVDDDDLGLGGEEADREQRPRRVDRRVDRREVADDRRSSRRPRAGPRSAVNSQTRRASERA